MKEPFFFGASKQKITPKVYDIGMFGWSMTFNVVKGVHSDLFSRAFYFEKNNRKAVYVLVDLGSISLRIFKEVCRRIKENYPGLGLSEQNIMLTATHTHSAPGGYSEYFLYLITIPGFSFEVFETIVSGIVRSIVRASKNKEEAVSYYVSGEFPKEIPVAFNRRVKAYNRNPDVRKVSMKNSHLAIDRTMYLLRVDSVKGKPLGLLAWFGVHATCVHNDKNLISSDNKGLAAEGFEKAMNARNPEFVAGFPQTYPGDVSPNFKKHRLGDMERGVTPDDFKNAQINAQFHIELANELFRKAISYPLKMDGIKSLLWFVDMSKISIDKTLGGGRTAYPAIGSEFFLGTKEGPGTSFFVNQLALLITALHGKLYDKPNHGNKKIIINSLKRHFLNRPIEELPIPEVDTTIKIIRRCARENLIPKYSLTPYILPVQAFRLGELIVTGFPTELTTVSGMRIKKYLKKFQSDEEKIIVNSYANAYAGYTTTPEEYSQQLYEGASTHFGPRTLLAYMTVIRQILEEMEKENPDVSLLRPFEVGKETLKKLDFKRLKEFRD